MTDRRPNFLFIITDQQRADHVGAYGNGVVRTPSIDTIAERGLSYDKFYVSCPICMPNRATLMTGRLPSANGVLTNGRPLPLNANTFVELLRAAGYKTAHLGKSHLQVMTEKLVNDDTFGWSGDGTPPPEGLDDAWTTPITGEGYDCERWELWVDNPDRDIPLPYYGFETVRFANLHGDKVQGHYSGWLKQRHPDSDSLRGPDNATPDDRYVAPQAWRTAMPEELYPTRYVEEITIDYLEDYAASDGDAPFFIHCSFPDPHHPFTPPGRYWDMFDPDDMELPASFAADHVDPPPFMLELQRRFEAGTAKRNHVHPYPVTEREARESIALTYGMIAMIDDSIGRILEKLDMLGLSENTVVVFTSDHGDLMGDHGLMLKHCFQNEGLIRTPFIWADPDAPEGEAGSRSDLLSGTIDIASTVLARAGLAPYNGIQGFDIVGAARDGEDLPRLGIVIEEDQIPENADTDGTVRTRSFVTGRWRLTIWLEDDFGELYDRDADPDEINNLWNDPAAQADKAKLMEMMLKERIRLDDRAPKPVFVA